MELKLSAPVVLRYFMGQGLVSILNVVAGLLILWILPVQEYALYVTATLIQTLISVGSDMGISQGVNTLGARALNRREFQGSLLAAALACRKLFFFAAVPVAAVLGYLMLSDGPWFPFRGGLVIIMAAIIGWVQSHIGIKRSILNIHHDERTLLKVGLIEACARLALVLACVAYPLAELAVFINLLALILSRRIIDVIVDGYVDVIPTDISGHKQQILHFVFPLVPASLYLLIQGNISIFLLGVYGETSSIAEVGALNRLGQVIGLLMVLNSFLIQPLFARIDGKEQFVHLLHRVLLVATIVSFLLIGSSYMAPNFWVLFLGEQYETLGVVIPLAVAGPVIYLLGATIYTIAISQKFTRWQSWVAACGILSQVLFVSINGVNTTADALLLNMLPSVSYLVVQSLIVIHIVRHWPRCNQPAEPG